MVILDVADEGDLPRRQVDFLPLLLVVNRPSSSKCTPHRIPLILVMRLDVLVDRIQRLRTHDLLAIQVVPDVIILVVPLHGNVADGVSRLL